MSLDIGVGDGRRLWPIEDEPSLALEDDGYYWFLEPLFQELYEKTEVYVDLYGAVSLKGEDLAALEQVIASAIDLVATQPETWQVCTGTQITPERKHFFQTVERDHFLAQLAQFQQIIARAKELGQPVVCFGD